MYILTVKGQIHSRHDSYAAAIEEASITQELAERHGMDAEVELWKATPIYRNTTMTPSTKLGRTKARSGFGSAGTQS